MERLNDYQKAQKWLEGYDWDNDPTADDNLATICEALQDIQKYKDLEEQGLLLKLPCKVGDKLYVVNPRKEILELTVKEFSYRAYRIPRLEIYFEDAHGFETCLFDGTLNENVFFTQAEAEEKLRGGL